MGIVVRQSFLSSVFAFLGVAIGYINIIILMPKYLTQEESGIVRTINSISFLMVPFIMFGMNGAILKYYPKIEDKNKQGLINLTFLVTLSIYALFVLIGYVSLDLIKSFFSENASALNDYFLEIGLLMGLMALFTILESFSKSNYDISSPNLIREILYKVLNASLIMILGFQLLTFTGYIHSLVLLYFVITVILFLYVKKRFNFKIGFKGIRSFPIKGEVFTLSAFTLLGGIGSAVVLQIDQIMVTKYLSLESNSIYSTALFMALVVNIPRKFVSQISIPIITKSFHNKDYKAINTHYKKASNNHFVLGAFLLTGILTNLHNIYEIMPNGDQFKEGFFIVYLLGLAKLLDMTFSLNGEIIYLSKYYRYTILFVVILAIITIITNLIFIPIYGTIGAAYATLITYFLYNISRFIFLKIKYDFSPFSINTFFISMATIMIFIATNYLPAHNNPYFDILIRGSFTTILYFFYVKFFKPTEELYTIYLQLKRTLSK